MTKLNKLKEIADINLEDKSVLVITLSRLNDNNGRGINVESQVFGESQYPELNAVAAEFHSANRMMANELMVDIVRRVVRDDPSLFIEFFPTIGDKDLKSASQDELKKIINSFIGGMCMCDKCAKEREQNVKSTEPTRPTEQDVIH